MSSWGGLNMWNFPAGHFESCISNAASPYRCTYIHKIGMVSLPPPCTDAAMPIEQAMSPEKRLDNWETSRGNFWLLTHWTCSYCPMDFLISIHLFYWHKSKDKKGKEKRWGTEFESAIKIWLSCSIFCLPLPVGEKFTHSAPYHLFCSTPHSTTSLLSLLGVSMATFVVTDLKWVHSYKGQSSLVRIGLFFLFTEVQYLYLWMAKGSHNRVKVHKENQVQEVFKTLTNKHLLQPRSFVAPPLWMIWSIQYIISVFLDLNRKSLLCMNESLKHSLGFQIYDSLETFDIQRRV